MKNITDIQALELFKNNPVSKGSPLTPYKLIVGGVITYKDWLGALKHNVNKDIEKFEPSHHIVSNTKFGKKVREFIKPFGFEDFMFGYKFNTRSEDCDLESIKLINLTIRIIRFDL